jgi:hypothetical protein
MSGSGIDAVIVINLDRSPHRWATFQQDWRDVLPWDRVVRLSATDGQQIPGFGQRPWFHGRKRDRTWAGRAGCLLSHARALRHAKAQGWARVLILEDDAVPASSGGLPAALAKPGWDMMYLGASKIQNARPGPLPDIAIIHGGLDLHAYAVTATVRDWLAEHLPDETTIWNWVAREGAIDRYARRELGLRFRIMICRPIYAAQRAGPSEITPQDQSLYGADMNLTARRSSILSRTGERIQNRLQWVRRRIIGF